ncbi:MAG: hypothetical protein BGO49_08395 [Planctomycetales bacterium 71-10]|nr:MAG: hypothetical protein BGO49_08395 [Planctomycetales bacterium 71-10]
MPGRWGGVRSATARAIALAILVASGRARAQDPQPPKEPVAVDKLMERLEALERRDAENAALREQVRVLQDRLEKLEGSPKPEGGGGAGSEKPAGDPPAAGRAAGADFSQVAGGAGEAEARPGWTEVGKNLEMKTTWNNGIQMSTLDDAFRFHIGGRVDFDSAWFRQDPNLLVGDANGDRLRDGGDFRRMRLRADGRFWDNIDFVFEVNFANFQDFSNTGQQVTIGSVGLTDVNVTFREVPILGNLKVGHLLPPISLEHMTSSNFVYYMERSPAFDAFINRFDYANGANAFDSFFDDRATLSAAILRTGSRTVNPFGAGAGDGEYGAAARATFLPIYKDEGRRLLHLGASLMHRALDEDSTSPSDRSLVRSGAGREIPNVMAVGRFYSPRGQYYINPEVAAIFGRWSFSAEYLYTGLPSTYARQLNRNVFLDPRGAGFFQGLYAEMGYFLTEGDSRRYNRKLGTFDRTVPMENAWFMKTGRGRPTVGRGAVQLLARYSFLDLVSGNPVLTPRPARGPAWRTT